MDTFSPANIGFKQILRSRFPVFHFTNVKYIADRKFTKSVLKKLLQKNETVQYFCPTIYYDDNDDDALQSRV